MERTDLVVFRVQGFVEVMSAKGEPIETLGEEEFSITFPVRTVGDLLPEQLAVNNISESQTLMGDLAKQCAMSSSWKAAGALSDKVNAILAEKDAEAQKLNKMGKARKGSKAKGK